MSQTLGDIKMTAVNFAQRGWSFCDGQLLPISSNAALFSLLGTTFGGDGRSTFALPDLRGRVAIHPGVGPGLSPYKIGQKGGNETVTLNEAQIPPHVHSLFASDSPGGSATPGENLCAEASEDIYGVDGDITAMEAQAIGATGGGLAHTNVQPFLAIYHVIAMQGLFPSRN